MALWLKVTRRSFKLPTPILQLNTLLTSQNRTQLTARSSIYPVTAIRDLVVTHLHATMRRDAQPQVSFPRCRPIDIPTSPPIPSRPQFHQIPSKYRRIRNQKLVMPRPRYPSSWSADSKKNPPDPPDIHSICLPRNGTQDSAFAAT